MNVAEVKPTAWTTASAQWAVPYPSWSDRDAPMQYPGANTLGRQGARGGIEQ